MITMPLPSPLRLRAQSLTIFRSLLKDPTIAKFLKLLASSEKQSPDSISDYADFAASLFHTTVNFSEYLLNIVLENENFYMLKRAENEIPAPEWEDCLEHELHILEEISRITSADICTILSSDCYLPQWETSKIDFCAIYGERMKNLNAHGYGIFAKYSAFMVEDGQASR
ncbi:MAG: hypothetical protein RR977_02055 [Oscillospiraceae bacterium]